MKTSLNKEAQIIGRYLVQDDISAILIERYIQAIKKIELNEDNTSKCMEKVLKHPWKIAYYDAALAFRKPMPHFRRKIFIMLAILETSTDYTHKFLMKERSLLYLFRIAYIGIRAVWRLIIGIFLLR